MAWTKPTYNSSNVAGIDTDGNDLVVRFRSGAEYVYENAADLAQDLTASQSPGAFIWRHLKTGGKRLK